MNTFMTSESFAKSIPAWLCCVVRSKLGGDRNQASVSLWFKSKPNHGAGHALTVLQHTSNALPQGSLKNIP
jgi:hypothetical protein